MATVYKHGAYGEFAQSIGGVAIQSGTTVVYVGTAPVNLIRGYASAVNEPVRLTDFASVQRLMGYSPNWATFTLCEAFKLHFNNTAGNAGPIVAINVLDPATHKKAQATNVQLSFVNKRATITSDTIILDTFAISDKVEGTDYTVDYNYTTGQVIIEDISEDGMGATIQATYSEIDTTNIDESTIIGGISSAGVYTGLGCVALVYQKLNLIPNLIAAPRWSENKDVYTAMVTAGTKINGHWDAFILADIPTEEAGAKIGDDVGEAKVGGEPIDTIEKAIQWKTDNGYTLERSKVFYPQFATVDDEIYHGSTLCAWKMLQVDAENDGIPMETPSNKSVPIARQYFGESSNAGFDQQRANDLNAAGISTAVYWGGQWVLWGGHTAAYEFNKVTDNRVVFDNNIRMMMYITNSFQQEWGMTIDEPMTLSLADTIKNREQEKADALVAIGALIGTPVVNFIESENPTSELVEGNFIWDFEGTPTPQFKSGTLRVAYTDEGFSTYYGEEA